jgi:hypothetical protein
VVLREARPGRQGRLVFVCAIALPVLYACFLAAFSVPGFPAGAVGQGRLPWLADKPVGEDGFYMLTIAWSLASGSGPVSRSGEGPTTGFQPLATLVYAALAWIVRRLGGDKWSFVRSVIALGGVAVVVFAWLLGRLTAEITPPPTRQLASSIAWSFGAASFFLFRLFTYGLETGLYLILVALVVLMSLRLTAPQATWPSTIGLGAMIGLTGWARVDFGAVVAVTGILLLVWRAAPARRLVVCGLTALVVMLPWLAWIRSVSETIVPSSARAQAALTTLRELPGRTLAMLDALVQQVSPWSYTGGRPALTLVTVLVAIPLAMALAKWGRSGPPIVAPTRTKIVIAWTVGLVALAPLYAMFVWATHFYARYAAPVTVLALPLLASASARAMSRARPAAAAAVVSAVMLTAFVGAGVVAFHTGRIGNLHVLSAGFVADHFPGRRIGAFQSGVIGYFNPDVVNLDGKINGAALRATAAGRLAAYVDGAGIDVLIDWPEAIRAGLDDAYLRAGWVPCHVQPPLGRSLCLVRRREGDR